MRKPAERDIQQVCENGHQITGCYNNHPEERKEHCPDCGVATITACPSCNKEIQGVQMEFYQSLADVGRRGPEIVPGMRVKAPDYCCNCGKPYPWTENKIVAAIQVFAELVTEEERETIEEDIKNITKDIPQAQPAAIRMKRLCDKYGPVAYNVITDLASKTVAEVFKGNYPPM